MRTSAYEKNGVGCARRELQRKAGPRTQVDLCAPGLRETVPAQQATTTEAGTNQEKGPDDKRTNAKFENGK
jgi:hypothetical protein